MGIKDLWSILTPFCERKPLFELQGKTVAVDLSCWVCEAQNIAEYQVQPRMYLRNLYFRTCYLLLMDVNPVFVLEGKAPTLKHDTMAARNAMQFKGQRPKTDGVKTGKGRSRFNHILKQCEEMLKFMGLACVTGKGEAEAMCAYLNEDGLVSGCISQDSDCFAYGAKTVYRNFSIAKQGAQAASGGAVDIYDLRKASKAIGFDRNKIIALAILVGSDYNEGISGIGKDSALKLFEKISDEQVLDRLRSWKENKSLYEEFDKKVNDKNICSSCGHWGKIASHTKNGCKECKTHKGCDFSRFKEERLFIKNELNMRAKALTDPNFPNEDLIEEFLIRKDNVSKLDLDWKQPDVVNFVKFAAKFLTWEEIYSFEKMLPVLTRWQIVYFSRVKSSNLKGILYPDYIKKIRNPKGVPSYEIVWKDQGKHFDGLIPSEQFEGVDLIKLYSTIEPQHLVETAYPDIVEIYKLSKVKPKKTATKRKKKNDGLNVELNDKNSDLNNGNQVLNVSLTDQPKVKKTRIRKPKVPKKTIDSYFKKAVMNNFAEAAKNNMQETVKTNVQKTAKTDTKENNYSFSCSSLNNSFDELDCSKFGDENDLDLSYVVQDIINRDPLKYLREQLENCSLSEVCADKISTEISEANCCNESFFMTSVHEGEDLFEKTFNESRLVLNISSDIEDNGNDSGSDTEEYEFDEEDLRKLNLRLNGETKSNVSNDSFGDLDNYVPLLERIQKQ